MITNYTPLDIAPIKQQSPSSFDVRAIFLSLIVATLIIVAVLLFILIQKKLQELAGISLFA